VSYFQISHDETVDNKPIIFVGKRVKTHLRQCRIPKFSGGGPRPRSKRREKRGEGQVEERRGVEKGEGDGEVGREGLKEREGMKIGEKEEWKGEEFGPPMFQTDGRS
jgi:hypothetical protein